MVRSSLTKSIDWKDVGGIYQIRNNINGKVYIGRTICFYRRSSQYTSSFYSRNTNHINSYMLNSMIKYGIDNFTFSVLEVCETEDMKDREYFWMDYFNSYGKHLGYNLRRDNEGGMIVHEETSKKISERLKKEWSEGIRSGHSEKLKQSWNNRDREAQGRMFSKLKTKYFYEVYLDSGMIMCDYTDLKNIGLKNAVSNFHRKKADEVFYKGIKIVRKLLDPLQKSCDNGCT